MNIIDSSKKYCIKKVVFFFKEDSFSTDLHSKVSKVKSWLCFHCIAYNSNDGCCEFSEKVIMCINKGSVSSRSGIAIFIILLISCSETTFTSTGTLIHFNSINSSSIGNNQWSKLSTNYCYYNHIYGEMNEWMSSIFLVFLICCDRSLWCTRSKWQCNNQMGCGELDCWWICGKSSQSNFLINVINIGVHIYGCSHSQICM